MSKKKDRGALLEVEILEVFRLHQRVIEETYLIARGGLCSGACDRRCKKQNPECSDLKLSKARKILGLKYE